LKYWNYSFDKVIHLKYGVYLEFKYGWGGLFTDDIVLIVPSKQARHTSF